MGVGVLGLQPIEDQELSGGLQSLLFLAFFSLSLLIMQQNCTEAVVGAFSHCLGFCGMRLGLLLLARHWCIAGVFQQKVIRGCLPSPGVEVVRSSLWDEEIDDAWVGTGRDLDWCLSHCRMEMF